MSHSEACFEAAVSILVTDGPVKKRLLQAYETHLNEIQDTDLPKGIRESYCRLSSLLHRVGPIAQQSEVRATIQKMSSLEATQCAELIFRIYIELIASSDRIAPLKVVESSTERMPRYISQTT